MSGGDGAGGSEHRPAIVRAAEAADELYRVRDTYFPSDQQEKETKLQTLADAALALLDSVPPEERKSPSQRAVYEFLRGKIWEAFPDYRKEAEDHLSKAVKLNPSLADAWLCLGMCIWKKGDLSSAKNCFSLALSKGPNKKILCQLSMLERKMSQGTENQTQLIEDSICHAKEAATLDIKDGNSWYNLGNAYLTSFFYTGAWDYTKLQQSLKAYQNAEKDELMTSNPDLYFNCATANRYLENYERALQGFEAASLKDPGLNAEREVEKITNLLDKLEISIKGQARAKWLISVVSSLGEINLKSKHKKAAINILVEGLNKSVAVAAKVLLRINDENRAPLYFLEKTLITSQNQLKKPSFRSPLLRFMARSREALVLLIDVGPSMHGVLPEVEKVCSMLVQKKLIFGKSDEVGIVLFGTEDTNNDLEKEVGGYEHVVVLRNVKVVDGDSVDILQNLPRGTRNGDFLDAVIVGMDMLIKKYGHTNKGKQRLCLITDARHPIKAPSEGTKEDQVHIVCQQMQDHGMRMDSIVIRENSAEAAHQKIMDENDCLLQQFSQKTKAKATYVGNSTALLGALRTRNISPVTVFRGDLELSSTMKIKVWVYKKTSEEKFPTLKKFSDKAPSTDKYATNEVKVDFEYKIMEDPDKVVPPEQRIKGYRYGPQVVPISSAEWDAVKFKPEKSVKLLGFADASNIMRHYYMKDVYIFIPEPGNSKAIVASSAIARAMKAMNKVAILRCVWRQGQGNVVVGVLTPNISCADSIPDSFYFNVLPFAEDVREFQFPSFSSFPSSWQPNEQQQEAADNLVKMLDLASPGKEEILQPDYTPNPVLERFYRFLDLKSRQPDAEVPPLDGSLKRITEPDSALLSKSKPAIDNFHGQYELKENLKKKKSSRRAWREKSLASDEEVGAENKIRGNESVKLIKDSSLEKVEKIGDLNPVQDFEAMMARRDSSKWVRKAIKEMQDYIYDLLENSYEGNTYPKAIECLFALRKGCILEQEPREFNRYLHRLYEKWKTTDLADFLKLLSSKSLTLISKSEAEDSDVTDEDAKNFPVKPELATQ